MNPVAFRIGFLTVYWYGLLAGAAMLTGYLLSRHIAVRYGVDEDKFDWLVMFLLPMIIVGARAAYVIALWPYFRENPHEIIRIDHGGLGSHGAIIAGVLTGFLIARAQRIDFWNLADAFAPALPLAHIFIRLGNFINGELYGLPTNLPWGITFPGTDGPHHPSMLYEAIVSVGVLFLAVRWALGRRFGGECFLKTLLLVSLVRVAVDYTRPRGEGVILGMMLTQVLAMGVALLSAAFLYWRREHAGNEMV